MREAVGVVWDEGEEGVIPGGPGWAIPAPTRPPSTALRWPLPQAVAGVAVRAAEPGTAAERRCPATGQREAVLLIGCRLIGCTSLQSWSADVKAARTRCVRKGAPRHS